MEALAEMLLSLFGSIFPVRFEFPLKNGVLEGVEADFESAILAETENLACSKKVHKEFEGYQRGLFLFYLSLGNPDSSRSPRKGQKLLT